MSHSKKAVGGVLLLAALIGACGGDDEAPAAASPIATATSTTDGQTSTPSPTPTPTPTEEPTTTATQNGQANQPPTASFTAEPSCTTSNSTEITFTSTSTDPDGDELSHSWDIQSGTPSTATGQVVTGVTFPNVAPYPVTLSVDDGRGGTDSATTAIGPC